MYQAWRKVRTGVLQTGAGFVVPAAGGSPSFPANGVLDNFNRANEGPPMTGWTQTSIFTTGLKVLSNVAVTNASGFSLEYWNAGTFAAKQEAYVTLTTKGTGTDYGGVLLRLTNPTLSSITGYWIIANAANTVEVYRIDSSGSQTLLGSAISQTVADGDALGAKIDGSTITVYFCTSGGSCGVGGAGWTSIGTRSDSTYSSAGYIGMAANSAGTVQLDNFGGGAF